MLKPPGYKAESGARHKVCMHIYGDGEMLIGGRQFAHFGGYHVSNILLEQILKATNPFSAQH